MKRRYLVRTVGIVVAVLMLLSFILVLGGCGTDKSVAEPEKSSDAVPDAVPIVIGSALPTGFLYGWAPERGIILAAEEINAAGGVNVGGVMHPLQVEVLDTRDLEPSVPVSDALSAIERLIMDRNVDFFVGGPARSEAAMAGMDLLSRHQRVTIFTTGFLTPMFQKMVAEDYDKHKYCFRIHGNSQTMVGEMLALYDSLQEDYGFEKVAIMVQDVAHARAGGEIMNEQLQERGWSVTGPRVYPTGTLDYSDGLFRARDFGAQVLFIWMDMPESSVLMRQWYDMELPALPIGFICAAEQPDFWDATEGKGEYTIAHLVNAGNAPCEATSLTMDFVRAYEARWGLEPEGLGTSSSYQAVYTLVEAIERAGSIDPDAVAAALEETDIIGVYGRVRFDENHQIIPGLDPEEGAVPQLIQWQDGKRETVFPPVITTSELKLPPWME